MPIFQIKNQKIVLVKKVQFSLEKDIQKITEANLEIIFGLEFVASEFNLENFWLDTLAFNSETKAFVIIEYKKSQNISIMDQGQTYLNLVLDHKADVLLEYNGRKNKNLTRKDINWGQTRVMFISPNFTIYQKRALHPKLPFELWEVSKYEDNIIGYNQIQPLILARTGQSIPSLSGTAAREIKVYTEEDILKKCSSSQIEIMKGLIAFVEGLDDNIQKIIRKGVISYKHKAGNSFVNIGPSKKEVRIYSDYGYKLDDEENILMGRGMRGRHTKISSIEEIDKIKPYIKQAFEISKKANEKS